MPVDATPATFAGWADTPRRPTERLDEGWSIFEPMPGRPMREYVALPPNVIGDPDAARTWVERAANHGRSLPPRPPKKAR